MDAVVWLGGHGGFAACFAGCRGFRSWSVLGVVQILTWACGLSDGLCGWEVVGWRWL